MCNICVTFSAYFVLSMKLGVELLLAYGTVTEESVFVFKKLSGDVDIPQNLVKSLICNCL